MQKQTKSRKYWQKDNFFKSKQLKPKSTISESVKGICTNIWYKLGGESIMSKRKSTEFDNLVLLGKKYHSYQLAEQHFRELFWFTYRKELKICGEIKTDLGWGCLIRVGQMLMANSLKRYFDNSLTPPNEQNIIFAFLDDSEGVRGSYSFQRIFQKGKDRFQLKTGDWFNISQICFILMSLQNQSPMKGSEDFKMIYFNQTLIFLDEVFKKIGMQTCLCDQKKIICPLCNHQISQRKKSKDFFKKSQNGSFQLDFQYLVIDQQQQNDSFSEHQTSKRQPNPPFQTSPHTQEKAKQVKFDLLLVVSTRISQTSVDHKNFQGILELMNLPTSVGMIGGVPGKGLYFVGACDDNLIYMDPHLVQNPINTFNLSKELNSFHCSDMRLISRQKLDPSIAFAFYIRNLHELSELIETIQRIKKRNPESVPISYMWENQFKDDNEGAKSNQFDMDQCSPDFSFVA